MKQARMLGSYVEELAKRNNVTAAYLGAVLNCSELHIRRFFKGRAFLTFTKLGIMADMFNVPLSYLLAGDYDSYKANFIDCNQEFDNDDNREMIFDIIDDYMDLYEAVECDRINEKGGGSDA